MRIAPFVLTDHILSQNPGATHVVSALVTLDRPAPAQLADCTRSDKYERLLENTQQQRADLLRWIEEHGLAEEVLRIGASTTFNLLFVCCTQHAAAELAQAPGVKEITIAGDCDLLSTSETYH